jgi:hypothetical protein
VPLFVHILRVNTFRLRCGEQFLCFDMVFRRNRLGSTFVIMKSCTSKESSPFSRAGRHKTIVMVGGLQRWTPDMRGDTRKKHRQTPRTPSRSLVFDYRVLSTFATLPAMTREETGI